MRRLPVLLILLTAWSATIGGRTAGRMAFGAEPPVVGPRLSPPRQVELPPLPASPGPQAAGRTGTEATETRRAGLPAGEMPRRPTLLPSEKATRTWVQTTRETPPLAVDAAPALPALLRFPVVPRSRVDQEVPAGPPVLARFPRDAEGVPRPQDDVTTSAVRDVLTRPLSVAAPQPLPPQRLGLPDPDAPQRALRLPLAPTDAEPPAAPRDVLPRPTFPVK